MDTMAKILGIISGALGIANTAIKLNGLIKGFRNAPRELLSLSQEVKDMHFVFIEVEKATLEQDSTESNLAEVLERANTIVIQLRSFIDVMQVKAMFGARRLKWIREKDRVKNLLKEMQGVRRDLDTLLKVNTV